MLCFQHLRVMSPQRKKPSEKKLEIRCEQSSHNQEDSVQSLRTCMKKCSKAWHYQREQKMNLAYRGTTECHPSRKRKKQTNRKEEHCPMKITRKRHRRERRSFTIEKCKENFIQKVDIT